MENVKVNPYADFTKKLFAYALAATGIFLLGRQELSIVTLAMALGAYFAAIGLAELIMGLNTCCKDKEALPRTEVVKKLWGYIAAVGGIFIAALQVNPRLSMIALGGYLIGSAIALFKNRCDVKVDTAAPVNTPNPQ